MKVLFLTRLFHPHIGGVETHVLEVTRELIKRKYEVTIICQQDTITNPTEEVIDGVTIYRIPTEGKKLDTWKWLLSHLYLITSSNVIHCHDVFYWYLPFRFLLPTKKVYTTFHGYEGTYPVSKKAIFIRRISNALSFGSIQVGNFIEKWYGTKADYVTYGGTYKKELIGKKNKKKIVLFIGRLADDTSYPMYFSIMQELVKKVPGIQFIVCGEGKYKGKTSTHFLYKGNVLNTSIYIQQADIIFASSYLSILEALSYGKRVYSIYNNPLKKDYLFDSPFKKYIHVSNDKFEIINMVEKELKKKKIYNQRDVSNMFSKYTWSKVALVYQQLWTGKKK